MDRHHGSVDDDVGDGADFLEHRSLAAERLEQRLPAGQRVRSPRLREAADEGLLGGVEEEQAGARDAAAQARQDLGKPRCEVGVAHVEDDPDPLLAGDLVEERLEELQRQVVDAEVAHVLEALVDVALARAREPRHDDEALRHAAPARRPVRSGSSAPSSLGRGVLGDLLVDAARELLGRVVALRLQELVAGRDLDQQREVAARGDGQAQERQLAVEDRVGLAVEPEPVVLLGGIPPLELDDELDRLGAPARRRRRRGA